MSLPLGSFPQGNKTPSKLEILQEIRQGVSELRDLPSFPTIVTSILNVVSNPYSDTTQVVEILEKDIGLSGRVLRVANSAYYGIPKKVSDLKLAVVFIGLEEVANLVATSSIIRLFPPKPGGIEFNYKEFWHHSLVCAEITQSLSAAVRYPHLPTAHVSGLLHDIGKLFLVQYFYHYYSLASQYAQEKKIPLHSAEVQVLGVDHGHIGAWVAERWNLPEEISNAIAQHHIRPADTPPYSLAVITDWADRLTHAVKGLTDEEIHKVLYSYNTFIDWLGDGGIGLHNIITDIQRRLSKLTQLREFL